jgi:hypothetical protein
MNGDTGVALVPLHFTQASSGHKDGASTPTTHRPRPRPYISILMKSLIMI